MNAHARFASPSTAHAPLIDLVSPTLARKLLGAAPDAVAESLPLGGDRSVREMAAQMLAGLWKLNGETIALDAAGTVLDGKKRLTACVLAGCEFPAVVVHGVDGEMPTARTIGAHKRRTTRDIMKIEMFESPAERVAAAVIVRGLATNNDHYDRGGTSVTPAFVKALFEMYPQIWDSILATRALASSVGIGRAILAGAHFMFGMVDPEARDDFFAMLSKPRSRQPVARALRLALAEVEGTGRVPRRLSVGFLVKAWNAFRDQASEPNVRLMGGERIPLISGLGDVPLPTADAEALPMPEADRRRTYRDLVDAMVRQGARIGVRTIQPGEAAEILADRNGPERTGVNRPISAGRVDVYARDMAAGKWRVNGHAIKFGASGRLVDGQHRLTACVESGVALRTLVIEGIDDESFGTMDLGKAKELRDFVREFVPFNHSLVTDVACVLWRSDNGFLGANRAPSVTAGVEAVKLWQGRIEAAVASLPRSGIIRLVMTDTQAVSLFCLLAEIDRAEAERFLNDVVTGANLAADDPALALRTTLLTRAGLLSGAEGRTSGTRMREGQFMALSLAAWNMRRLGQKSRKPTISADSNSIPTPV